MKKIVYTINIGDYDDVLEGHAVTEGWEYYLITDRPLQSYFWNVIQIEPILENRKESRRYKWVPHQLIDDIGISLYVDSNIVIRSDLNRLVDEYLTDYDIVMTPHVRRNCLYAESMICRQQKLDYEDVVKLQVNQILRDGYPKNSGLHEGTLILRKHTSEINEYGENVWKMIEEGSHRDQLCLDYVAWKKSIPIGEFSRVYVYKEYFYKLPHKRNQRSYK